MRGALVHDIAGIVARCGGKAQCATCHGHVDAATVDEPEPARPDEDEMLDFTAGPRRPHSRLSCRLRVTRALDGLIVHLPERQD
ncbi:2Fe-2S iron-sulfur cluster-binding protein [Streptomyces filipinensis]|uniref:2Fe-2S iron-sulfur cluster-binding protein n=1 Tax=Streptomyces filipinensis TaxID=66887 RepID=UPI0036E7C5C3